MHLAKQAPIGHDPINARGSAMSEEAQPAGIVPRPLVLDPERAGRAGRAPYAIIDIGSNSVRLVVYDQLGRAPLPRFNEKSLCRLGEGLAQTGAINADGFRRTIEALRRFRGLKGGRQARSYGD